MPSSVGSVEDTRPYEFVNAQRAQDEVAPCIDFELESGWTGFAAGAPRLMRSYFLPLALAKRCTQATAAEIRYADAVGRLETTSDALRSGTAKCSQVLVLYSDGTAVRFREGANGRPLCSRGLLNSTPNEAGCLACDRRMRH